MMCLGRVWRWIAGPTEDVDEEEALAAIQDPVVGLLAGAGAVGQTKLAESEMEDPVDLPKTKDPAVVPKA